MGKRTYNILFHTHTVSGIVISAALYVIFFAGTFSFFRDEINNWQFNHKVAVKDQLPNGLDGQLDQLATQYNLYGRDVELSHYYNVRNIGVNLSASKDSLASAEDKAGAFFYLDAEDGKTSTYMESYALGEFLYRLHFFAQIPYPVGYYLSGFVAFFFLFAIVTGIIVHWKKIISNFYVFRPWAKLKTLWTDAHTALGVIGFPFQFVYALTGAFFMIKGIYVLPFVLGLYDGDQAKLHKDLEYDRPVYAFYNEPLEQALVVERFVEKTKAQWPNFKVTQVGIFNYGDKNMHITINGNLDHASKFNGAGHRTYRVSDGMVVEERSPITNNSYLDGVKNVLYRLHLGDYAGTGLRIISFVFGLVSCVVILSGVMIWLVARDKKHVPEKRRRFNRGVANLYMALCLSMFPVTALEFILVKLYPSANTAFIYPTYFISWLAATLFFVLKKNIDFTNRWTLVSGGILSCMVPLINGITTGHWPWRSYLDGYHDVLLVDLLWMGIGGISLWTVFFKLGLKRDRTNVVSVVPKQSGKVHV